MNKKVISYIIVSVCFVLLALLLIFIVPSLDRDEDLFKQHYDNRVAIFENENESLTNVDVAFIGDSITEGYNLSLHYNGYSVTNRGIGGDTTAGLQDRLKVSLYDISPKVVVFLIGGNNILKKDTPQNIINDIENIFTDLKENLPDSNIIIQSIYPMGLLFNSNNETVKQINASLKQLSQDNSFTYIDIFSQLVDEKTSGFKPDYTDDGLHPNENGYNKITEILKPEIDRLLDEGK